MTTVELRAMAAQPQYGFLREDEHLGERIIFLTLGGSYAYGTNVEGSDVDIRGCALNSRSDILGLGLRPFEQVVDTATDTTVYSFNKLVSLLLNCNPNCIELLGCKPEHYFIMTEMGRRMIDNRKLFLSKRAADSFGGYANQQLRRLENAIARDSLTQARKEEHIRQSMERAMATFEKTYSQFPQGSIRLYTGQSTRPDMERELFADVRLAGFPARQFQAILNDLSNVLGTYDKLNHRNKKDENHLNKHAMHLIRLYLMCIDILEKEDIITYREKDHDLLMSIRGGAYQKEDGTYRKEFFDLLNEYEKRLKYAEENTSLPASPDMKKIEEFVEEVNLESLQH